MHSTCPEEHLDGNIVGFLKQFPPLGEKISDLRRKICSLVIKSAIWLQSGKWKNSFERNFTFSDFFGRPGNIFWFFRCIVPGMVVQSEFHQPRGIYLLRKTLWENFLSFPDYERNFLKFHWNILRMVVKTTFYVFRGAVWASLSFLRSLQTCFPTLSDNRPYLWRKVSAALPKLHSTCGKELLDFFAVLCHVLFNVGFERKKILVLTKKVSSVLSVLHSKRRRTFWGNFFQKQFFFQLSMDFEEKNLELPAKSFQQRCYNCFLPVQWTTVRMIIIFSENLESFWTLSDNCADLWLKFSAAFPNVHSTCPKYFFGFLWMVLMFF